MSLTKSALAAAGLRPCDLARLLGQHPTTISRWISGDRPTPAYVALVLDIWRRLPDADRVEIMARLERDELV